MYGTVIYWAAPCFTQAERMWNRLCAEELRDMGYVVILPQDEATKCMVDGQLDFDMLAHQCEKQAISSDIVVAVLDGPDPDSGMSLEVGLKIGSKGGPVLGVRTDFRVSEDEQLNAMFRLLNKVIYFPSFNESYQELCEEIGRGIKEVLN